MGIKLEKYKVETEKEKVIDAWCDFCNQRFSDTEISCNGFGQIGIGFGYGSGFDSDYFRLQICDKCFLNNFGDKLIEQFKEKEYDIDKINKEIQNGCR
jgi:hypothetical protein